MWWIRGFAIFGGVAGDGTGRPGAALGSNAEVKLAAPHTHAHDLETLE